MYQFHLQFQQEIMETFPCSIVKMFPFDHCIGCFSTTTITGREVDVQISIWCFSVWKSNQTKHFSFIGNLLSFVFGKKETHIFKCLLPSRQMLLRVLFPNFKSVKEIWVTCLLWIVKNKRTSQPLGLFQNPSQRSLLITRRARVWHFLIPTSQMGTQRGGDSPRSPNSSRGQSPVLLLLPVDLLEPDKMHHPLTQQLFH